MTKRDPHPDNDLIDELTADATPGHSGASGGNVARTVGARAEEHGVDEDPGVERATGQDNPREDEMKGEKTIDRLDPARKAPSSE